MNPVGWFEIYVDDMERAKEFYQKVFNCTLEKVSNVGTKSMEGFELWTFPQTMDSYGAGGALCKMEGFKAGGNSTLVYFSCNDCSVEETNVRELGGKVEKSKMSIGPHGFISICVDTEGNTFGLHSMK